MSTKWAGIQASKASISTSSTVSTTTTTTSTSTNTTTIIANAVELVLEEGEVLFRLPRTKTLTGRSGERCNRRRPQGLTGDSHWLARFSIDATAPNAVHSLTK